MGAVVGFFNAVLKLTNVLMMIHKENKRIYNDDEVSEFVEVSEISEIFL